MGVLTHYFLWKVGLAKAWTYYGQDSSDAVAKYARDKKRLAELGCWQGVHTRLIRSVMAQDGCLYAIDPYPAGRLGFSAAQRIAHKEVEKESRGKIVWLRMTDLEAAHMFDLKNEEPFDFIFSDTLNTYEGMRAMWKLWSSRVLPGGIFMIANSQAVKNHVTPDAGSVQFVQNEVLQDSRFEFLEAVETFTILRRKNEHL